MAFEVIRQRQHQYYGRRVRTRRCSRGSCPDFPPYREIRIQDEHPELECLVGMFVSVESGQGSGRSTVQRDGAERECGTERRFDPCGFKFRPRWPWRDGAEETHRASSPSVVGVIRVIRSGIGLVSCNEKSGISLCMEITRCVGEAIPRRTHVHSHACMPFRGAQRATMGQVISNAWRSLLEHRTHTYSLTCVKARNPSSGRPYHRMGSPGYQMFVVDLQCVGVCRGPVQHASANQNASSEHKA